MLRRFDAFTEDVTGPTEASIIVTALEFSDVTADVISTAAEIASPMVSIGGAVGVRGILRVEESSFTVTRLIFPFV